MRAEPNLPTAVNTTVSLAAIIDSTPTAMIMIDTRGVIMLVYARHELLGQRVEMLVPQEFRAKHPSQRASFFAAPQARRMGAGRDLFWSAQRRQPVPRGDRVEPN